jgi:hypothetical protein
VSRKRDGVVFQNEGSRKRSVIGLLVFAVVVGLLSGGAKGGPNLFGFAVAVALVVVAYRNWVSGLFLTSEQLIIRNVSSTQRIPLSRLVGTEFIPGSGTLTSWGYVHVKTVDGGVVKVTALRRGPDEGDALARSINITIAKLKKAS